MDTNTIEKINTLAKSLKENRLATNMEEAYSMAKQILSEKTEGESKSVEHIQKEMEGVKIDQEMSADHNTETKQEVEDLTKEIHEHKELLEELKKEIEALKDIKKDAKEVSHKEKIDEKVDDLAEKDLPGQ